MIQFSTYLHIFPRKLHSKVQHIRKDHFNILNKRIMPVIIAVQPHLVRINHTIIILSRNLLHRTLIPFRLLLRHILGNHLILQPVLQCCRPRNTRTQLQHISVRPDQLVSISRHIRPRPHKTHIPDQHIPQPRQLIQFIVTHFAPNGVIRESPATDTVEP